MPCDGRDEPGHDVVRGRQVYSGLMFASLMIFE